MLRWTVAFLAACPSPRLVATSKFRVSKCGAKMVVLGQFVYGVSSSVYIVNN